jgi:hypothetical protein
MYMSEVSYRIAQSTDVDLVFNYAAAKLHNPQLNEIENQIQIWNSDFRREALEHYFKLGWSFLGFDSDKNLKGFFLGQPLLFLDKNTQSLWIEYISADSNEIYTELVDIAYRLSREKHFQRVLFSVEVANHPMNKTFPFQKLEREIYFLKTVK